MCRLELWYKTTRKDHLTVVANSKCYPIARVHHGLGLYSFLRWEVYKLR